MTTLQFRVATPDDLARIHSLVESAYRGEESKLGWTTEAHLISGKRIDTDGLLAKITHPDGAVLIATCPDDDTQSIPESKRPIIACCEVARCTPQVAYFGLFAVSPRRQGGGIGRQVLAYAEDYCRRTWGVEKLELSVIPSRQELVKWYSRRGYSGTGELKPFPFEELAKVNSVALTDDLRLMMMGKDLREVGAGEGGVEAPKVTLLL